MWELCLKRADSDHYGYPERGLKFLVHKGAPKVLNYLERKPKLLMVSKAEVLNLVFITLRPLWINEPLEMEESVHVHLCAQGEALSHTLDFKRFMTADQMILITFAGARIASGFPLHVELSETAPAPPPLLPSGARLTMGL